MPDQPRPPVSSRMVLTPRDIKIPPEILGKIYLQNELPHYPEHRGSRYPPMVVSKSWRNAALLHPQLWIRVNITEYSDLRQSSPDTLQTWLSRSQPCLLDVVLHLYQHEVERDYGRKWTPKDANLFVPIMKVLFAQTHRWESLDVLADVWQYSYIFRVIDSATHLRNLLLSDSQIHETEATVYQSWSSTGTPRLLLPSVRSLSVSLAILSISAFPALQLPNLTELTFDNSSLDLEELVTMMKDMPRLAVLNLNKDSFVSCERIPVLVDAQDGFSRLETLAVRDWSADYDFFPHLAEYCPNLHNVILHYRNWLELPSSETESLTDVTLVLEHENNDSTNPYALTQFEARDIMMFCPNSRKLTLIWQPDENVAEISFDPFIEALAFSEDGQVGVVTKLEHLVLRNAVLSTSLLLEMLRLRSSNEFRAIRDDRPFNLTLDGCYGLPDIKAGSFDQVKRLFANPPEINMPFGTSSNPYAL